MSDPYIGEIRFFAGTFAPVGWALCDGRQLPISQYDVLYSLIGTTYGGDGINTFGVPDLRGRLPMHMASAYPLGSLGGSETVSLVAAHLPVHRHPLQCSPASGTESGPVGNFPASSAIKEGTTPVDTQFSPGGGAAMNAGVVQSAGTGEPHNNVQPFLVVNLIIALEGIYPPQQS